MTFGKDLFKGFDVFAHWGINLMCITRKAKIKAKTCRKILEQQTKFNSQEIKIVKFPDSNLAKNN